VCCVGDVVVVEVIGCWYEIQAKLCSRLIHGSSKEACLFRKWVWFFSISVRAGSDESSFKFERTRCLDHG